MKRWLAIPILAGACASVRPVPPPPPVDAARVEALRARSSALADEVALLEWQAKAAAEAGNTADAERYARLARTLVEVTETRPEPPECPETSEKPEPMAAPASQPVSQPTEPAPERKRRRRRARPDDNPEAEAPDRSIEALMQERAEALRDLDSQALEPDGRVWLASAQQALIDAQRAVTAGATEKAFEELVRVDEALVALGRALPTTITSTRAAVRRRSGPVDALQLDLQKAGIETSREDSWLIVPVPESRRTELSRKQREQLEGLGRLLRVYPAARLCVRGPDDAKGRADEQAALIRSHLEKREKIDVERFIICSPRLAGVPAKLFVGLTFDRRRS